MLKLIVTGQSSLAHATAQCCLQYFSLPRHDPDVLWVCHDTPIGANDEPQTEQVLEWIRQDIQSVTPRTLILISSQIPVGTTAKLEREFPGYRIAHSPENIRVKTAVEDFRRQARIVVGSRGVEDIELLKELLSPFTGEIIFTTPETAEMVKHALNCYLGMSIAFINEVAKLCRAEHADADVVSHALRTDFRVSPNAPLRPGPAFGGGHLARDIHTVTRIAERRGISIPIISHIRESNGMVDA